MRVLAFNNFASFIRHNLVIIYCELQVHEINLTIKVSFKFT